MIAIKVFLGIAVYLFVGMLMRGILLRAKYKYRMEVITESLSFPFVLWPAQLVFFICMGVGYFVVWVQDKLQDKVPNIEPDQAWPPPPPMKNNCLVNGHVYHTDDMREPCSHCGHGRNIILVDFKNAYRL